MAFPNDFMAKCSVHCDIFLLNFMTLGLMTSALLIVVSGYNLLNNNRSETF